MKEDYSPFEYQTGLCPKREVEIPEEYACLICKNLTQNAVIISCCGCSYCEKCILRLFSETGKRECPLCKASSVSIIPNRVVRLLIIRFIKETGYVSRKTKNIPMYLPHVENGRSPQRFFPIDNHPFNGEQNSSKYLNAPMVKDINPPRLSKETDESSSLDANAGASKRVLPVPCSAYVHERKRNCNYENSRQGTSFVDVVHKSHSFQIADEGYLSNYSNDQYPRSFSDNCQYYSKNEASSSSDPKIETIFNPREENNPRKTPCEYTCNKEDSHIHNDEKINVERNYERSLEHSRRDERPLPQSAYFSKEYYRHYNYGTMKICDYENHAREKATPGRSSFAPYPASILPFAPGHPNATSSDPPFIPVPALYVPPYMLASQGFNPQYLSKEHPVLSPNVTTKQLFIPSVGSIYPSYLSSDQSYFYAQFEKNHIDSKKFRIRNGQNKTEVYKKGTEKRSGEYPKYYNSRNIRQSSDRVISCSRKSSPRSFRSLSGSYSRRSSSRWSRSRSRSNSHKSSKSSCSKSPPYSPSRSSSKSPYSRIQYRQTRSESLKSRSRSRTRPTFKRADSRVRQHTNDNKSHFKKCHLRTQLKNAPYTRTHQLYGEARKPVWHNRQEFQTDCGKQDIEEIGRRTHSYDGIHEPRFLSAGKLRNEHPNETTAESSRNKKEMSTDTQAHRHRNYNSRRTARKYPCYNDKITKQENSHRSIDSRCTHSSENNRDDRKVLSNNARNLLRRTSYRDQDNLKVREELRNIENRRRCRSRSCDATDKRSLLRKKDNVQQDTERVENANIQSSTESNSQSDVSTSDCEKGAETDIHNIKPEPDYASSNLEDKERYKGESKSPDVSNKKTKLEETQAESSIENEKEMNECENVLSLAGSDFSSDSYDQEITIKCSF